MNKNKFFFLVMLVMTLLSLPCSYAQAARVPLTYEDPTNKPPFPKSPILIPEVDLEGYTLTFFDSCVGCTLQLVNADDEVEYSTVISSDTLVLPSALEGEYEIRIVCGDHYFYGFIEL